MMISQSRELIEPCSASPTHRSSKRAYFSVNVLFNSQVTIETLRRSLYVGRITEYLAFDVMLPLTRTRKECNERLKEVN